MVGGSSLKVYYNIISKCLFVGNKMLNDIFIAKLYSKTDYLGGYF